MRRSWIVVIVAALCAGSAMPVARAAIVPVEPPAVGCVETVSPSVAAQVMLHPRAEVVSVERIRGVTSALVSVPVVHPGARHRLVRTSSGTWCDAVAGFNAFATGGDVAVASLFASVAAARYFDGVTVRSARLAAPGLVELETHARTNGVVAQWSVAVDGAGVQKASWRATEFAVKPFTAVPYGPTALPGASMDYGRDGTGLVAAAKDPFAVAAAADHGVPAGSSVVRMPDGFDIIVSRGHAPYAYPEARTGAWDVDVLAIAVRTAEHNYRDFLDWGLEGGWDGPGHVFIDGGLAPFCAACVLIAPVFNVHMLSSIGTYLELLGYTYPDPELMFSTVMGHEIFHNFQGVHGSTDFPVAFVEGMARFQETAHDYSHVSHQPGSLVYGDGINGCNGYLRDISYALSDHWYDACYFWMSLFVDHGPGLIKKLVETDGSTTSLEAAIEQATGAPLEVLMSQFATRALTGSGLVWGPIAGSGPELDWSVYLDRWSPGPLGNDTLYVAPGAVVGGRVAATTEVSLRSSAPTRFTVVRRSPGAMSVADVVDGETVQGPASGEDVWLVGATGRSGASIVMSAAGAPTETEPLAIAWSDFRSHRYSSKWLPTQSATSTSSADIETFDFALHAEANDSAVSPLSASSYAYAALDGTATLAAGDYVFVAKLALDEFALSGNGGLPSLSRPYAYASVDAHVWCEDYQCSEYDSHYVYSDYGYEPVDALTLVVPVQVERSQQVQVDVSPFVRASSSSGRAVGDMAGRIVSARFVKID